MTPEQIILIRKSFQKTTAQAEVAADIFYERLFEMKPNLRLMFPSVLAIQKQTLISALAVAVASLDKMNELKPVLEDLGRRHAAYGVREEHYPLVGSALIWTLKMLLGAVEFDAATEGAWTEMFGLVSAAMMRAGRESFNDSSFDSLSKAITLEMPKSCFVE